MTRSDARERQRRRLRAAIDTGELVARVAGDCMRSLVDGAQVGLEPSGRLLPGDVVVTLSHDGRLLAHRLVGWRPSRHGWLAVTMADRAARPDLPVPRHDVLGRVAVPIAWRARGRAIGRYVGWLLRRLVGR